MKAWVPDIVPPKVTAVVGAARLILLGKDIPSEQGRHTERREQAGGHLQTVERFRSRASIACEIENRVAVNSYRFERASSPNQLLSIVPNHPVAVRLLLHFGEFTENLDEFFGSRVGQRVDEYRFDGGENNRSRSHAQRNR